MGLIGDLALRSEFDCLRERERDRERERERERERGSGFGCRCCEWNCLTVVEFLFGIVLFFIDLLLWGLGIYDFVF